MSAKFVCDGCGEEAEAVFWPGNPSSGWHKPLSWFQRGDEKGIQDACSRECIEKIALEKGVTRTVLPEM